MSTRSNNSQATSRPAAAANHLSQQVEPFPSEDSPSQVGSSVSQIPLVTWKPPSEITLNSNWRVAAGEESLETTAQKDREQVGSSVSQIPLMPWKSPSEITLNSSWQVAAGEESLETTAQKDRELGVLEAIYPRPSSIPLNPILLVDEPVENDQNTPIIRTTPIEDDEENVLDGSMPATTTAIESSTSVGTITPMENAEENVLVDGSMPATTTPAESSTSVGTIPPEIEAAIRDAFAMSNCSPADIDFGFLAEILSNAEMVELLVNNHPRSSSISMTETVLAPPRPASTSTSYPQTAAGPVAPGIILPSSPALPTPVRKDGYYYRSLIQQHGMDSRASLQSGTGQELSNCTQLTPTACCKFFNTPRGCRKGANCLFQHSDVPSAKRVKLERKNTSK